MAPHNKINEKKKRKQLPKKNQQISAINKHL